MVNATPSQEFIINEDWEMLGKQIVRLRPKPSLLSYYLDEPETRIEYLTLLKYYRFVKHLDPDHLVSIVCWCPWYYNNIAKVCDVIMSDPYPCNAEWYLKSRWPKHLQHPPTAVGEAINQTRKAAINAGKEHSYWTILQEFNGYGWPIYPTAEQSRCMHYLALIHETRGITRYIFRKDDTPLKKRYKQIIKPVSFQINHLSPIIMDGETLNIKISPENTLVEALLKKYQDKYYLIAVNAGKGKTEVTFTLPAVIKNINTLFENRKIIFSGNSFKDNFTKYQPHVYEIE